MRVCVLGGGETDDGVMRGYRGEGVCGETGDEGVVEERYHCEWALR